MISIICVLDEAARAKRKRLILAAVIGTTLALVVIGIALGTAAVCKG